MFKDKSEYNTYNCFDTRIRRPYTLALIKLIEDLKTDEKKDGENGS